MKAISKSVGKVEFLKIAFAISFLFFTFVFGTNAIDNAENNAAVNKSCKISISRRSRCAIECYSKCANSGTPKAVYCNCPLSIELEPCNSVNEQLLKDNTIEGLLNAETSYKDVRTIAIHVETIENAFIYIFEYAASSADNNLWIFAGASSNSQIIFKVPDPCRDYQYRLIVVLRSTNPAKQLLVFRSQPIPVRLPDFVVEQESIRLDQPKESSDEQSVHISISWHNPAGYDDSDIYGYESPLTYPIRCQTPEEQLPSPPRVELIEGGARMHLNLPIDVLQERCRIYMEVRMLPRCIRLESFDIQASIEIDCQKFPYLTYCIKSDLNPQCTNFVDLWGEENGIVKVVWQSAESNSLKKPLYYSVNYGPTRTQGSKPIVRQKIVENNEMQVSFNTTQIELYDLQPEIQYGIQICGIYSIKNTKSPFHIASVIPFMCHRCEKSRDTGLMECLECSKNEEELNQVGRAAGTLLLETNQRFNANNTKSLVPLECYGRNCASRNITATHFIQANVATLEVLNSEETKITSTFTTTYNPNFVGEMFADNGALLAESGSIEDITSNAFTPNLHQSKIINTNRFIPIHSSTISTIFSETTPTNLTFTTSTEFLAFSSTNFDELDITKKDEIYTTTHKITTIEDLTTNETKISTKNLLLSPQPQQQIGTTTNSKIFPKKQETSFKNLWEETINSTISGEELSTTSENFIEEEVAPFSQLLTERRLHQKTHSKHIKQHLTTTNSCELPNGIICEYDCLNEIKCECPKITKKSCIRGILCPLITDLRAVYENSSRTLKLYSKEISELFKNQTLYDKFYLEFGELNNPSKLINNFILLSNGYSFVEGKEKEYLMIKIKDFDKEKIFDTIPFEIKLKKVKIVKKVYGVSVCVLNTTQFPFSLDKDGSWYSDKKNSKFKLKENLENKITSNKFIISDSIQAILSPVDLKSEEEMTFQQSLDTQKGLMVLFGPIFFLFGLLVFGITILCINLIRKKRRFRNYKNNHKKLRYGGGSRNLGVGRIEFMGPSSQHFSIYRPTTGLTTSSSLKSTNELSTIPTQQKSSLKTQQQNTNFYNNSDRFFVPSNLHF